MKNLNKVKKLVEHVNKYGTVSPIEEMITNMSVDNFTAYEIAEILGLRKDKVEFFIKSESMKKRPVRVILVGWDDTTSFNIKNLTPKEIVLMVWQYLADMNPDKVIDTAGWFIVNKICTAFTSISKSKYYKCVIDLRISDFGIYIYKGEKSLKKLVENNPFLRYSDSKSSDIPC